MKKGDKDWAYFSKQPKHDSLKMIGSLEESVSDLKVSINVLETHLDFNRNWLKPIHKGKVEFKEFGLNDKVLVKKIA